MGGHFDRPHPKDDEGKSFSLFVTSHPGGGGRGTPPMSGWGYPIQVKMEVPLLGMGYPLGQVRTGVPKQGCGTQGWGPPKVGQQMEYSIRDRRIPLAFLFTVTFGN